MCDECAGFVTHQRRKPAPRIAGVDASDVLDLFLELAAIPSPPGEERAVADRVLRRAPRRSGSQPDEDDAGARIGATPGNSSRGCPGRRRTAGRRSSSAPTSTRFRRRRRSSRWSTTASSETRRGRSSAPTTRLRSRSCSRPSGASWPRAARTRGSSSSSRPRRRSGSSAPRSSTRRRSRARVGFVYDHAGPIGEVVSGAPSASSVDAVFRGRAAHAGMHPEEGRSAIVAAARAIADLRLGRIDDETTANVGGIRGRDGAQHRPGPLRGRPPRRARTTSGSSRELVQEMVDSFTFAAAADRVRGRRHGRGRVPRPTASGRTMLPLAARLRRARRGRLRAARRPRRAAARTRTSSTSGAFRAPTSRTGWPGSTAPTSTSRSPTSRRWSRSRWTSSRRRAVPEPDSTEQV